ncbi:MAG: UDP-N-acetylglucosamine--N-acetylmuramyl-(pentapeptide) pyrophosphoryl-undecaprenol N-acetylglucosamine transferase [Treponema sp.]|nr:UDP-N-acetylglucosamine--N-acetylmuramyl-(pentapeptide) pyrophosphoryl-undecaprenol N-acetylglucosamine transferase [Treponema sp.]
MNKTDSLRIVFAGGGTGGHIYPGIAVADALQSLAKSKNVSVQIYWIGNNSGMDRDIVQKNLVAEGGSISGFFGIPCGKLRRYVSVQNFIDVFKIVAGFVKSIAILVRIKPDCLFSKGGFVSVPPCWAARLLKIPYYTHECDFTPGLATRLNARAAKNVLVSYSETASCFSESVAKRCIVTGNPVRPVFYSDNAEDGFLFLGLSKNHEKPILLVLGGSLGAQQINSLIMNNLDWLKERYCVVHQTGKVFAEEHPDVMAGGDDSYKPYAFIYKEMPAVIQCADVILSRAGANSIWESAVSRKPMVLVPLCGSGTRGDQVDNARYFEKNKAAVVLAGKDADDVHLRNALEFFLDAEKRVAYSLASAALCEGEAPSMKISKIIMDGFNYVAPVN